MEMATSFGLDKQHKSIYNAQKNATEQYPALHPHWMTDMQFILYESAPVRNEDKAGVEEWRERITYICDDLHQLLSFSHQHFWCQVIFDESFHRCIDSYLKYAPRCYDVYDLPKDIQNVQNEIHKLVYLVCVRMATYKESKENHISPKEFGKIIYENYIFDIPKLMDLAVLYGSSHNDNQGNKPLLSKMIGNIFHTQPCYMDDLQAVVPTILQVFDTVCQTCSVNVHNIAVSPQKLDDSNITPLVDMEQQQFEDVLFYLCDTSHTLYQFLDVFPPASAAFLQNDTPAKLACVYEALFPALTEAVLERDWPSTSYQRMITKLIHQSQLCLLKICRLIVSHNYLSPLLSDRSEEETENCVEGYLHQMSGMFAEKRFLCHLEHLYPFRDDRDLLLQCSYPVDETRLQYVMDAVNEAISLYRPRTEPASGSQPKPTPSDHMTHESDVAGACAKTVTGIELDLMISVVHDLLPDLGQGFIQLCLEETNYDTEKTINMLLEGNVPPSLRDCPKDMPREVETGPIEEKVNILAERRNIFDDDEFDVFSRDNVDMSRIHQGKKEHHAGGEHAVLDDKSTVGDLQPLYDKYGSEDVYSMYDVKGGYEDEYDDTYDTNMIGARDTDELDELTNRRPFTVPRILGGVRESEDTDDIDTNEEEEEENKRKDQFVEDPAKIRQRQEERRATRELNRRGKPQHRGPVLPQPNPGQGEENREMGNQPRRTYDVKGNPKGQGQNAEVQHNRAWKEKHKGSRVHHNRKNLADKKRRF